MTMEPKRQQALVDLQYLEDLTGIPLHDVPGFALDQWAAGVRDIFASLDAPLHTQQMARAAFAGAYVAMGIVTDGGLLQKDTLLTASHVLRWLYERGEDV